ncbi:hypothetical protein [Calderihabitans maritimus]|uniref:TBC1 domain family member 5 n=1 Tax=Calderihabitans maritimus TaxID=1246530 RepID=A0A1Z5HQV9_9FIRM|nr:hypothetical protein [Calderihabitans maritimus]GAW91701.1 TBC1 domain family member 5 [Calderihabitans maritimus]
MMEYDRKIFPYAAMTFLAAPIAVVLHELAHLLVYIMNGIPAQFVSFSSAVPVGASTGSPAVYGAITHQEGPAWIIGTEYGKPPTSKKFINSKILEG